MNYLCDYICLCVTCLFVCSVAFGDFCLFVLIVLVLVYCDLFGFGSFALFGILLIVYLVCCGMFVTLVNNVASFLC